MFFQNKKFLAIGFIVLIFVSLVSLVIFHFIKESDTQEKWDVAIYESLKKQHGELYLDSNIVLSLENKKYFLKDLIDQDKKIFIVHVSELDCNTCVDSTLSWVNASMSNSFKDIILVSRYYNERNLMLFKRLNNIDFDIYNCLNFCSPLDNLNVPYTFILDHSMEVKLLKFPDKTDKNDFLKYLQEIKKEIALTE